jgi:eukaryotic-like serine/threonine-protein kinase
MRNVPATTMAPASLQATRDSHRMEEASRLPERMGRYELLVPIAKGGMGEVFAARLVGIHGVERLVAIKTLRMGTASHRAALLAEARITSRLRHPNVVGTLDLDEVGDVPYIVMELIDGVALSSLLHKLEERGELLSPALAAWIAMQCALGLHAAHELTEADGRPLGLVHRDVSPQNILLAATGEVKVADFGIAKFLGREDSTHEGQIRGKFAYMSPEHALRDEPDHRSDIFSLGIVLWEALTGRRLFLADNPARTLVQVREIEPPSPAELRPGVGAELAAITLRCLAKDRKNRYATAAEVADALRAALRSGGIQVDAADLAALVQSRFAEERADLARRIAQATAAAPLSDPDRSRSGHLAFASSPGPSSSRRVRPHRRLGALSVLGVAAAVAWALAPVHHVRPGTAATFAATPALLASAPAPAVDPAPAVAAPAIVPVAVQGAPSAAAPVAASGNDGHGASAAKPSARPAKPYRGAPSLPTRSTPESGQHPAAASTVGAPFSSL